MAPLPRRRFGRARLTARLRANPNRLADIRQRFSQDMKNVDGTMERAFAERRLQVEYSAALRCVAEVSVTVPTRAKESHAACLSP